MMKAPGRGIANSACLCLPWSVQSGNTKGGRITVPLTSCLTGLELAEWQLTIFVFICNRLIQTGQTGCQWYSDTSPFSIPRFNNKQGVTKEARRELMYHPRNQL